jgi:hypothetical protein
MFGWAPADAPMIVYRNRIIHLGASLKEMDWALREWLDKFEAVLRRLYWESAYVRFEAAYLGVHEFTWRPKRAWVEDLCCGRLSPIAGMVVQQHDGGRGVGPPPRVKQETPNQSRQ